MVVRSDQQNTLAVRGRFAPIISEALSPSASNRVRMNAWVLLVIAGCFEVGWAVGLEYSEGFSRLWPSVLTVVCLAASMLLLARAVQSLPLGTAYAVWTGIGAVGAATLGIVLFEESASLARAGFLSLIVLGVVGLNLTAH